MPKDNPLAYKVNETNKNRDKKQKGLSKFNPFGRISKALDKAKKKK